MQLLSLLMNLLGLDSIDMNKFILCSVVGTFWSFTVDHQSLVFVKRSFRSKIILVLYRNLQSSYSIFSKNIFQFAGLLFLGVLLRISWTFWIKMIFYSLITIYISLVADSDFTDFVFKDAKADLKELLNQTDNLKGLFTLLNLPKSHIRELFVENHPEPSLWTLYSEIYVARIKDFIKGTQGQKGKQVKEKELKFAPGRAVSGETLRSRKNAVSKNKWSKIWELVYNQEKIENLEDNKENTDLPDLLMSKKSRDLNDLKSNVKLPTVSYFSFQKFFNSWMTNSEKKFDAVAWISRDFQSHMVTFSTLCKWIVYATKLDKYGLVVSQLPTLLLVLMDALEVLERIELEQTQEKKLKSTHVASLIDGIFP